MKLRILALAALMSIVTSTAATSAFASEEEGIEASNEAMMSTNSEDLDAARRPGWNNPGWNDPGRGPGWGRRGLTCFARNVTGQTFAARGDWRMPARYVQQRALQQCRRSSGFFRFSCRAIGCR
jgi:hypothetical protein